MNDDVEKLIRFGEDSVLEFKSVRVPGKRVVEPDSREIADDFAAAANAVGATFLFGVNDKTHEIEGVPFGSFLAQRGGYASLRYKKPPR